MKKRILIDDDENETRVVVQEGSTIESYQRESKHRRLLKGNVYLAKIIHVEPSLQAAFVDFGGQRQGFLSFGEIHPDYYQIPIADREQLIREHNAYLKRHNSDDDNEDKTEQEDHDKENPEQSNLPSSESDSTSAEDDNTENNNQKPHALSDKAALLMALKGDSTEGVSMEGDSMEGDSGERDSGERDSGERSSGERDSSEGDAGEGGAAEGDAGDQEDTENADDIDSDAETFRPRIRLTRRYKIQEVIKRRQIILVQVVKEGRGSKGASLTTFLSLAGRFCVLMPNALKKGGVSRQISKPAERTRLKTIIDGFDLPDSTAIILRTAAEKQTKIAITRDFKNLVNNWNKLRELTIKSQAPLLIHEEADVVLRSLRDANVTDIDSITIEGEHAYKRAADYLKSASPTLRKKLSLHSSPLPLFNHCGVEEVLARLSSNVIALESGGSLVIEQTEALVSIDINSGKLTGTRHIEDTALKTNIEAAREIARQLRLRDLAGLIVIDFIDMRERANCSLVENKFKEALRRDRARIQVGRISQFGLLELSRQRLMPSLLEHDSTPCTLCGGSGRLLSAGRIALPALKLLRYEASRNHDSLLVLKAPHRVLVEILNHHRSILTTIEAESNVQIECRPENIDMNAQFALYRASSNRAPKTRLPENEWVLLNPGEKINGRRRRKSGRGGDASSSTQKTETMSAPTPQPETPQPKAAQPRAAQPRAAQPRAAQPKTPQPKTRNDEATSTEASPTRRRATRHRKRAMPKDSSENNKTEILAADADKNKASEPKRRSRPRRRPATSPEESKPANPFDEESANPRTRTKTSQDSGPRHETLGTEALSTEALGTPSQPAAEEASISMAAKRRGARRQRVVAADANSPDEREA